MRHGREPRCEPCGELAALDDDHREANQLDTGEIVLLLLLVEGSLMQASGHHVGRGRSHRHRP